MTLLARRLPAKFASQISLKCVDSLLPGAQYATVVARLEPRLNGGPKVDVFVCDLPSTVEEHHHRRILYPSTERSITHVRWHEPVAAKPHAPGTDRIENGDATVYVGVVEHDIGEKMGVCEPLIRRIANEKSRECTEREPQQTRFTAVRKEVAITGIRRLQTMVVQLLLPIILKRCRVDNWHMVALDGVLDWDFPIHVVPLCQ